MKVLVTGGAGFIGSHIVDELLKSGHEVAVIDNLSTGNRNNVSHNIRIYQESIHDLSLKNIFKRERPDVVIHNAAQVLVHRSLSNPVHDAKVNIMGTINLLENCRLFNVQKLIYASSGAVYGNPHYLGIDENHPIQPISFYGISKYAPEMYIKQYSQIYGLRYTILRYANVYGIRQDPNSEGGVVSIFIQMLRRGEVPVIYGDGEQTRDFIYMEDVALANIAALVAADGEILNISTNTQTTINQLLQEINEILGIRVKAIYAPARKGDILCSYLNNAKAKELLHWEPNHTLREGLIKTLSYYLKENECLCKK